MSVIVGIDRRGVIGVNGAFGSGVDDRRIYRLNSSAPLGVYGGRSVSDNVDVLQAAIDRNRGPGDAP
nr:MAG TPA: hypothetical protein [Caudoviricetes sp.]